MATPLETTFVPVTFKTLGGGLNSTAGALNVQDNEASDLLNVDFNKFGSVLKRNGYYPLSTNALPTGTAMGLYWYTDLSSNRFPVFVNQGKIYKMDDLDGTWDEITGAINFVPNALDTYTKLLLECNSTDQDTTFQDTSSGGKTVTNTETYDNFTVLMLHYNGTDGSTTITDSALGTHTVSTWNNIALNTDISRFGTPTALSASLKMTTTMDNYTVLLLHCDGANGSTTFIDSAKGRFGTPVGNAQISNLQSEFGGTSALFDGVGDSILITSSTDFNFSTTDWTVECWARFAAVPANYSLINIGTYGSSGITLILQADNNLSLMANATNNYTAWTPVNNTWYHIAAVKTSNKIKLFVDGSQLGSDFADTQNLNPNTNTHIGSIQDGTTYAMSGNIDEVRLSKGIARWTADFTPPTSAYASEGYLTINTNTDLAFTNSDYTIETCVYFDKFVTTGSESTLVAKYDTGLNKRSWNLSIGTTGTNQTLNYYFSPNGTAFTQTAYNLGILATHTWYHVAVCKSSSTLTAYLNGTTYGSLTTTTAIYSGTSVVTIGCSLNSNTPLSFFYGWQDEMKVSNKARWSGAFTPYLSPYGQANIVTAVKKLGTGSGEFKKYERLSLADDNDWYFSSTNFTLDFYTRFNSLTDDCTFLGQYSGTNFYWYFKKDTNANGNKLKLQFINTTTQADYTMTNNWSAITDQWYHLAVLRTGTNAVLYIDGVSQALSSTTAFSTNDVGNLTVPLIIGQQNNTSFMDGNLDEVRVSKGIARYSADFTPGSTGYGVYNRQDFATFLGYVIGTDKDNNPWRWLSINATASTFTVTTAVTGARLVRQFQNYLILANIKLSGVYHPSRFYWSTIKDMDSWNAADFIDVSKNDGDEITGLEELGDRLVLYKNKSIYVIIFTGDADIPFVIQKTNSSVGCASPYAIVSVDNGHIFPSYDGIYLFDGSNSYKLSDRINDTYVGINNTQLNNAVGMYQRRKNRYWLSLSSDTSLSNNFILIYDSFLNAWGKYTGFSSTCMSIFMVNGTEERPYFADNWGYVYRGDYGLNDTPLNTTTAINAYYATNWKYYDDLCDRKGLPHVYITHRNESNTVLTLNYNYDFYNGDQYTQSFSCQATQSVTALTTRRDLIGRGRFVMLKFSNNATNTTFRIDGLGTYLTQESKS